VVSRILKHVSSFLERFSLGRRKRENFASPVLLVPYEASFPTRHNLWRIPLRLSLAAVVLFAITLVPDILDKYGLIHIPSWLTMGSIDDARAILSAMMGAVATVLAMIFSVALLVLSMVATLFGPRLLYRFFQDWVTQATIGMFMGTFVYICLVPGHPSGSALDVRPANLFDRELGSPPLVEP
jgi:uncharacterized membrane protein